MAACPFCNNEMPCNCIEQGHHGFAQTLENRRHQGTHNQDITRDNKTGALKQGRYVVDTGGAKTGYYISKSRSFNSGYDGPGKGTW